VEDVEMAMALAEDTAFAVAYSDASNADAFWKGHIGYGKIYPLVERFIRRGDTSPEDSQARLEHHRAVKTYLSGHVHPT
jgi:hypothetical protein